MMFEYIGWLEVVDVIIRGLTKTFQDGIVTYDFARLTTGTQEVKCSEFAGAVVARFNKNSE
jgi:isocitrate dehydrogenase